MVGMADHLLFKIILAKNVSLCYIGCLLLRGFECLSGVPLFACTNSVVLVRSLVPRPLPHFQCYMRVTLKTWEWPGDEASCTCAED